MSQYQIVFDLMSSNRPWGLLKELIEVRYAVTYQLAFLQKEQQRVSDLRNEGQEKLCKYGMQILQEHGALEVINIGGGREYDNRVINANHLILVSPFELRGPLFVAW